jgi:hypothetical protein
MEEGGRRPGEGFNLEWHSTKMPPLTRAFGLIKGWTRAKSWICETCITALAVCVCNRQMGKMPMWTSYNGINHAKNNQVMLGDHSIVAVK